MIHWLTELREHLDADSFRAKLLNVFHYHTLPRGAAAFLTAFLLSLMFGERVIRKLISLKVGPAHS